MQKESIEEAIKICIENIQKSNINIVDKVELMMNIDYFFENYEDAIKGKTLKKVING